MKRFLRMLLLLCLPLPGWAQQALTGRVVSATDNSPLPGASVTLKHNAAGTHSDAEGRFSLPGAGNGDTLLISFLGYVPQELALRRPLDGPLLVTLVERSQGLQEVVVSTGYQQLPRERATGSFTQIGRETFNEQVGPDVLSRLEAVANGVSVNRAGLSPQLMVRGLSTINGPMSPLVVVDNFPYEGDIQNINPNDVESVTILKDAAAASIWGARAGNGVIVITTKKGRHHQPLSVEFNTNVTVSAKPDLSYLRQMSSSDFIDLEQYLFEKGYYTSQINSASRPVLSPVVELLNRRKNGTLSAEEVEAQLSDLRQHDVRDDYDRYVYQEAVRQQYALSLKGGSELLAWNMAAGYDRNTDQLAAGYNRLNLRFHNTLRPVRNLSLTTSAYYTQSESTAGKAGYGQIGRGGYNIFPYARLADAAGNPLPVVRDYSQAYKDTAGGGRLLDWNLYPLEEHKHIQNTTTVQDLTANLALGYQWPVGLGAEVKYQYERQQTAGRLLQGEQSYYTRNLVNRFTQLPPGTGAPRHVIPPGAVLDLSNSLLESQNLRGQLNFDRTWGKHTLALLAGGELRHARTTGYSQRRYGYNPDNLTFGQVDFTVQHPEYINGRLSFIPDNAGEHHRLNRFVSQFANAAYTFRDRYTLSVSARQDASNLFGLNTNDLWNPLWSTGLSWELSKESFFRVPFLPFLKLRGTYGFSGNTNPSLTAVSTLTYVATSPYTQSPYARFSNHANPDLTWETVGMWNVGLDFATPGNRLSGSLEYYGKDADNLYALFPLDYTAGVGYQAMRNVASIRGRGLDLELRSLNLNKALQWTTQLNFSYNREEVTDYYLGSLAAFNFVTPGFLITGVEGRPVYSVYSYRWAGLDPQTGNPQGYVNGEVSQDYFAIAYNEVNFEDLVYHGSALPTFFGSLGNTFSWKGLSLTARLSWKLGYFFRPGTISYASLYSNWAGHSDFADRWQQPGDERHTHVPSLSYPGNATRDTFYEGAEVLVQRGDHVRLQYVTASYALPRRKERQSTLKSMEVYLNLQNLGILWRANRLGLDPDSQYLNALPTPPSAALGLRLTL